MVDRGEICGAIMIDDTLSFVETTLPLVVARMPSVVSGRTIKRLVEGLDQVQARRAPYAFLLDTSAAIKFPSREERTLLIDWMTSPEVKAREAEYNIGSALVVRQGPARAVVAALSWIHPPPKPQFRAATLTEAVDWCCDLIVKAGLRLTPEIESFRAHCHVPPRAEARKGGLGP